MEESILDTIKKLLGITPDNKDFDTDIIVNINSVFMILRQLGVGPEEGFKIEDDSTTWDEYISDEDDLEAVKSYIYLRVKIMFDPPLNGTVTDALNRVKDELEWRLNFRHEEDKDVGI